MPQTMPISTEDVERFMVAKGAVGACAICGQSAGYDTFDEIALAKRFALFRFQFPGYDTQTIEASDVVLIECRNCRVLRVHNRKPIVEWVAANPAKKSTSYS